MIRNVVEYADEGKEFYPTPPSLAEKMLEGIDWSLVHSILEPSAGKGDLVFALDRAVRKDCAERHGGYYSKYAKKENGFFVDCIEIDRDLRAILRDRLKELEEESDYQVGRIVGDDFLKFRGYTQYNLIVMNPPFSEGALHLLKALEMQKYGGDIVCLLNAETIRNPFSEQRRNLKKLLDRYGAEIEFVQDAFKEAERKTDVEVAIVKVSIPYEAEESDIYERMKKAESMEDDSFRNADVLDLDVTDYIRSAISHFNVEVRSGLELIRQYRNLAPYIVNSFDENDAYAGDSILHLRLGKGDMCTVNGFVEAVRLKYWKALLNNPKFTGKLTSKARERYTDDVLRLKYYDFNEFNIGVLSADIMANVRKSIEEEIGVMFDRLTEEHSYIGETSKNRHYYSGWCTNKAWKIDKKTIMPCYGIFSEWSGKPYEYKAIDLLEDIEKVLNYFDGNMTADVSLARRIRMAFDDGQTKNIHLKFFKVTFYKKGTCHITYTCPELIERFNIYAAQSRSWLPPAYGKKKYEDMTPGEQSVVDEFQGKEAYENVLKNAGYYLTPPVKVERFLALPGEAG